jgi:acetyltransferase-like isoleucine patch superfamily enzyme
VQQKIVAVRNRIYSAWIKQFISQCGDNFKVEVPFYLMGPEFISIGDNFSAHDRLRIECRSSYRGTNFSPRLTIGNNVSLGYNVHIGCINEVRIGNGVLMASNIYIANSSHGYVDGRDIGVPPIERDLFSKGAVVIEDNVWIGENVVVLPNVTIGENAIIGAGSVVTKNVAPNSVVAGNPGRTIRTLETSSG